MLIGTTLQSWYAVSQVNLVTIGILTLIGQPYVYKFLWAPLFDRYTLPWFGRRRGWIFVLQSLLILGLFVMGLFQPSREPILLGFVALFVAFLSASQDIVIDAYRTDVLDPEERGLGAGLNTIGYRVAMLVAGAGALVLADRIGWKLTYWFMGFLMTLQLLNTYFSEDNDRSTATSGNLLSAWIDPLQQFLSQKQALLVIAFLIVYKLGDVFTIILGNTFLIRELGFSLTDIGFTYQLIGMVGILTGAAVGGLWMQRLSLYQALIIFGLIQAFVNLPYLFLALSGKNYLGLITAVFVENLGSGLGTVAFLAFIMTLCDQRYSATQYALFSALAAVGRVFAGPIAGIMAQQIGWIYYFFWAFLLGFPGVLMLIWLKKHPVFHCEQHNTN